MQGTRLNGLHVAILVSNDFEQVEMTEPREALVQAGAQVTLISPKSGQVRGMNHDEKADSFHVDVALDQANPSNFDALMLPGGALNADALRMEPRARTFAQEFDRTGRPMAIICHAPWLLVSAGLVKGRTLTSYYTIQDDIRNAGGNWVDQEMVQDRNWVTSRSPQDLSVFSSSMINLFASYLEQKAQGRQGTIMA